MSNVVYHVDSEKKVVVAVLKCDPDELLKIVGGAIAKFDRTHKPCGIECSVSWNIPAIEKEYVGIARCSGFDVFDEEFGKKLALARAKVKKANEIKKLFFEIIEWLDALNYFMGRKNDSLYRNWIELLKDRDALLEEVRG